MSSLRPYSIIAAVDPNMALGCKGHMGWHIPSELQHFKFTTLGGVLIMGRATFDSLGRKPLPGRFTIVVSEHRFDQPASHCAWVGSPAEALDYAQEHAPNQRVWVAGGAKIYQSMLDDAADILLSKVPSTIAEPDVFFPSIDPARWRLVEAHDRVDFQVEHYKPV